ncbi:hypothetical protein QF032_007926 [Streptomyces achromogenes]|nr:hypothetical protein [Streptomyces achromogenes]
MEWELSNTMSINIDRYAPRRATRAVCAAALLTWAPVACASTSTDGSATTDTTKASSAAVTKAAKSAVGITSLHYRLSGTVPAKGRVTADASMTAQPPAMSMDLSTAASQGEGGQLRIRFTNKTMYVGGSAIHSEKLKGKHWLSAAPAIWGQGAADNQSYGVLPSQLQANPATQSTLLNGSKDLRAVGTETVDGVTTTHYKGTVNYDALSGERLDQFMQLEVSDPLTMDLWIDSKDRPKQFRLQAEHHDDTPTASAADTPLDLTITFLDINQPATIKAPPADDTAPLAADTQH